MIIKIQLVKGAGQHVDDVEYYLPDEKAIKMYKKLTTELREASENEKNWRKFKKDK